MNQATIKSITPVLICQVWHMRVRLHAGAPRIYGRVALMHGSSWTLAQCQAAISSFSRDIANHGEEAALQAASEYLV